MIAAGAPHPRHPASRLLSTQSTFVRRKSPLYLPQRKGERAYLPHQYVLDMRFYGARVRMGALQRPEMRVYGPYSAFAPRFEPWDLFAELTPPNSDYDYDYFPREATRRPNTHKVTVRGISRAAPMLPGNLMSLTWPQSRAPDEHPCGMSRIYQVHPFAHAILALGSFSQVLCHMMWRTCAPLHIDSSIILIYYTFLPGRQHLTDRSISGVISAGADARRASDVRGAPHLGHATAE